MSSVLVIACLALVGCSDRTDDKVVMTSNVPAKCASAHQKVLKAMQQQTVKIDDAGQQKQIAQITKRRAEEESLTALMQCLLKEVPLRTR